MTRTSWRLAIVGIAAGAFVAGALAGPEGAAATDDQPILAGNYNDATSLTYLVNTYPGGTGLDVEGDRYGVQATTDADGGTGVYAVSLFDTGIGVEGEVFGSGSGVYGSAPGPGVGVNGSSDRGVGVQAQATSGTALRVVGKATFSRSGVVTVAGGTSSRSVRLAGVTKASMVLATAQQVTAVSVQAAVPAAGVFSIRLTGPAPAGGLKVAYFVLN